MVIRVLACLNSKLDDSFSKQSQQLDHLEEKNQEIIGVLAFNHAEIREAILSLRNGEAKTITRDVNHGQGNSEPSSMLSLIGVTENEKPEAMFRSVQSVRQAILDMLHFRKIVDRYESVKAAHKKTFQWIFCDPGQANKPWSDFPSWLEKGTGCYWIQGKAGSGKSTLMKFIYQNPHTQTHLRTWARNKSLSMASFFFWYLGYNIQKSQEGLLRSLLYDILKQNPWLMSRVMPELFIEASKQLDFQGFEPPSITELVRWFKILGTAFESAEGHRMCIFIDGIDEYIGDYNDLLKLFVDISSESPSIKFVLSSRPISACMDMLSGFPFLCLQDLTQDDIRRYTIDLLQEKAITISSEESVKLSHEVVNKSCGIFLWVSVVVRSLLEGLQDGDSMEELLQRLSEMPSELGSLYQHMLQRIPPKYQMQASEMLLLMAVNFGQRLGSPDGGFIQPLPALQLSYALQKPSIVLGTNELHAISHEDANQRARQIEARIRSRCLGLLELREGTLPHNISHYPLKYTVEFIHRTVVEFLNEPEVRSILETFIKGAMFDPCLSLFSSSLCMAKALHAYDMNIEQQDKLWLVYPWRVLRSAMLLAKSSELHGSPLPPAYLDHLNRVLSNHWHQLGEEMTGDPGSSLSKLFNGDQPSHWFRLLVREDTRLYSVHQILMHEQPHRLWQLNMALQGKNLGATVHEHMVSTILDSALYEKLILCGQLGFYFVSLMLPLPEYLEQKLAQSSPQLEKRELDLLLDFMVHNDYFFIGSMHGNGRYTDQSARVFELLLESGADPNAISYFQSLTSVYRYSIWEVFLYTVFLEIQDLSSVAKSEAAPHMARILTAFVNHGADLSMTIEYESVLFTPEAIIKAWQSGTQTSVVQSLSRVLRMMQVPTLSVKLSTPSPKDTIPRLPDDTSSRASQSVMSFLKKRFSRSKNQKT
jgi:hypothetical protein